MAVELHVEIAGAHYTVWAESEEKARERVEQLKKKAAEPQRDEEVEP